MEDIKYLITKNESRKLEFKREIPSSDKIIKTAIAFSNSQGGYLIIGVEDNNKIVGIDEEHILKSEENISNTIYDNCYPSIIPEIYSVKIEKKFLIVCYFYPSSQKPHYIRQKGKMKGCYIRLGSSNRLATQDIIEELERQRRRLSFDRVVNYDVEYKKNIFQQFDVHIINKLNEKPNLLIYKKLNLLKEERDQYFLTNLGIIFSNKRRDFFPLIKIECARFKGKSTKVFLDQASYDEDIISSIENSISFVKRNIKLGATIGEVYRENKWEYPLLALREIIVNAVVHRDYSIIGSDIKIAIFDDMIEVTSPGVLIIDKEKLGLGYSELRNPLLGSLFKKFEIIEQWGTGYEKIRKELEVYPEIRLEVDDDSSFVQIKLIKTKTTQETIQETTQETTKDKIIGLLKENPNYTKQDLMKLLDKADATIKEHLSNLKKEGRLERVGSTKSGYWKVIG